MGFKLTKKKTGKKIVDVQETISEKDMTVWIMFVHFYILNLIATLLRFVNMVRKNRGGIYDTHDISQMKP